VHACERTRLCAPERPLVPTSATALIHCACFVNAIGEAVADRATSGGPKFFLGTDSAPHPKGAKVAS